MHWLKSLSTVSMFYHLSYLILCKDAIHTFFTCAFRNVIYKIVTRNNYSGILLNRIWSNISLRLQICGFHLTFKSQNLRSHTFLAHNLICSFQLQANKYTIVCNFIMSKSINYIFSFQQIWYLLVSCHKKTIIIATPAPMEGVGIHWFTSIRPSVRLCAVNL